MQSPRNCPRCGKLFIPLRRNVCPACVEDEEQYYEDVRDYLRKNPGAPAVDVCEATGVTEEILRQYIKEGRLQTGALSFDEGENDNRARCDRCGAVIPFGRICRDCAERLSKGFQSVAGELKNKADGPRLFRTSSPKLDRDKEDE